MELTSFSMFLLNAVTIVNIPVKNICKRIEKNACIYLSWTTPNIVGFFPGTPVSSCCNTGPARGGLQENFFFLFFFLISSIRKLMRLDFHLAGFSGRAKYALCVNELSRETTWKKQTKNFVRVDNTPFDVHCYKTCYH